MLPQHHPASPVSISEMFHTSRYLQPPHQYQHGAGARLSTNPASQQYSFFSHLPTFTTKPYCEHNTSKLHCQHLGCLRGRRGSKSKSTAASASPQSLSWNVSYVSGSYVSASCRPAAAGWDPAAAAATPCLEVSKWCLAAYDRAPGRGGPSESPAGIY